MLLGQSECNHEFVYFVQKNHTDYLTPIDSQSVNVMAVIANSLTLPKFHSPDFRGWWFGVSKCLRQTDDGKRWRKDRWNKLTDTTTDIQLNPALTDFRGPINYICYRWNSIIGNIENKRKWVEGIKCYRWNLVKSESVGTLKSVRAGLNCISIQIIVTNWFLDESRKNCG